MASPLVKIHVDAGIRAQRRGSVAAVCRDSQGTYLGSAALVIGEVYDPAPMEAIACREAISLAQDLQVHNLVISSDSKQVVNDILKGSQGAYGAVISEIQARSAAFNCSFIFESRVVNFEAHKLAKFALTLAQGRHVWLGQPHDQTCIPLCGF